MKKNLLTATGTAAAIITLLSAFTWFDPEYPVPGLKMVTIEPKDASIPPFQVSTTEVTNDMFAAFLSAVGRGNDPWFTKHGAEPGNLPARNLTKADAIAFCRWLTYQARDILGPNQVFSLPRDLQYSAMFGIKPGTEQGATPAERMASSTIASFSWGVEPVPPVTVANANRVSDFHTVPPPKEGLPGPTDGYSGVSGAGGFQLPGSPLFDLAGNVDEMVFEDYSAQGELCVRGGSFKSDTTAPFSVTHRSSYPIATAAENLGFRLVIVTK